jgi:type I restriction enzyme S subunit
MEVRPGSKKTEVGVIPEDWGVKRIGDLKPFTTSGSRGWAAFYSEYGSAFIRITNLSRMRIYLDLEDLRYVKLAANDGEAARTQLRDEDVLISITADIGIVGCVTAILPKPAYINQHIALVRFDPARTNSRFVAYFLASEPSQKFFRALTDSGAKAGMNLTTIQQVPIALPPTKAEQEAIAEALGDADALIESLERLVAKKRQLKQGAMQDLLTGKRRLPGFSGEWDVADLDSVANRITGLWGVSDASPERPRFAEIIRAGDISQDGLLASTAPRFLSEAEFAKTHCQLDDIVISTSGNGLGKVWWCDGRPHVAASNFVRILRPIRARASGRYLSYILRSQPGLARLQEHTATSAYPNLRPSFFATSWIPLPSISEQNAIAAILSDMDADIAALEAKLAKARQLKQGMMQELLTGRIRLV